MNCGEGLRPPLRPSAAAGATKNFLKQNTPTRKFTNQMGVDSFNVLEAKVAPAHSRLISHDEKLETGFLEALQGRNRAWNDHHVFRSMEIVLVFDQGPIAIQENSTLHSPATMRLVRSPTQTETRFASQRD